MADIVIAEFMADSAVEALRKDFDVLYDKTLVDRSEDLKAAIGACRALIVRNRTQVRGALLEAGKKLQVVGRLGVGLDNIDLQACRERGISVFPATGANNVSVAEYVLGTLLVLARGSYFSTADVASGAWPRERLTGGEIGGKTLGLIGFGGIARDVTTRAQAFGMTVCAYDPFLAADAPEWARYNVTPATLETLLADADAVSLHVPLTDGTRNLLNTERIAAMKPGALLVNTSRGGIVDEKALADALKAGRLGGAAIDVFAKEPLPAGTALEGVPNLILTPHIAGITRESNVRVSSLVAERVAAALKGARA